MDMERSMLYQAQLPPSFWAEEVSTATSLRNITPMREKGFKIPVEILAGKKPEVRHLRILAARHRFMCQIGRMYMRRRGWASG